MELPRTKSDWVFVFKECQRPSPRVRARYVINIRGIVLKLSSGDYLKK